MATAKEHRTRDYTRALEREGVATVVDGEDAVMFFGPLVETVSEFDRTIAHNQKLFHLDGVIEKKRPGQIVTVDGDRWLVLNHWSMRAAPGWCLSLERSVG